MTEFDNLNTAIEVIEKRIKEREGVAFLWRLLVHLLLLLVLENKRPRILCSRVDYI